MLMKCLGGGGGEVLCNRRYFNTNNESGVGSVTKEVYFQY